MHNVKLGTIVDQNHSKILRPYRFLMTLFCILIIEIFQIVLLHSALQHIITATDLRHHYTKESRLATRKTYYLASALSEGGGSDAKGGDSGGQSLLDASGDLEAVGLHGHGCKTTEHIYTLFSGTLIERKRDKNCTLSFPVPFPCLSSLRVGHVSDSRCEGTAIGS